MWLKSIKFCVKIKKDKYCLWDTTTIVKIIVTKSGDVRIKYTVMRKIVYDQKLNCIQPLESYHRKMDEYAKS